MKSLIQCSVLTLYDGMDAEDVLEVHGTPVMSGDTVVGIPLPIFAVPCGQGYSEVSCQSVNSGCPRCWGIF